MTASESRTVTAHEIFNTIVTADGQQYYLVIDMSAAYTDDDGVNVTPDMDETTEETTEEAEPEPEKKKSGGGLMIYIILGAVALVVILVKVVGGNKGKADQNDDALYGEGGEEDEDEPEPLENLD